MLTNVWARTKRWKRIEISSNERRAAALKSGLNPKTSLRWNPRNSTTKNTNRNRKITTCPRIHIAD